MFQEAGVVAVSKTCFTMATDGILETLATKYPQVINKAGRHTKIHKYHPYLIENKVDLAVSQF